MVNEYRGLVLRAGLSTGEPPNGHELIVRPFVYLGQAGRKVRVLQHTKERKKKERTVEEKERTQLANKRQWRSFLESREVRGHGALACQDCRLLPGKAKMLALKTTHYTWR